MENNQELSIVDLYKLRKKLKIHIATVKRIKSLDGDTYYETTDKYGYPSINYRKQEAIERFLQGFLEPFYSTYGRKNIKHGGRTQLRYIASELKRFDKKITFEAICKLVEQKYKSTYELQDKRHKNQPNTNTSRLFPADKKLRHWRDLLFKMGG